MVTKIEQLKQSLILLSSPARKQLEYLKNIGLFQMHSGDIDDYCVDEIALEFEDAFIFLPELERTGQISCENAEKIRALDKIICEASGESNSEFWTVVSLKNHSGWDEIRILATECIPD